MFFFKKNSPILCDILSDTYVDFHSHLLPNIDDGATSLENTKEIILKLQKFGFKEFITTPHVMSQVWENSKIEIEAKYHSTREQLAQWDEQLSFRTAAEYMLDDNFSRLYKEEQLLTLKDNFVLVEMSYLNPPLALYDMLFELQVAGYKPILAHPERYSFYHNALENYDKLKRAGCLFQLNLLSSVGYYGVGATKAADYLLKNNLIDFVGSDVHHLNHVAGFEKKVIIKHHESLQSISQNNIFFKS